MPNRDGGGVLGDWITGLPAMDHPGGGALRGRSLVGLQSRRGVLLRVRLLPQVRLVDVVVRDPGAGMLRGD